MYPRTALTLLLLAFIALAACDLTISRQPEVTPPAFAPSASNSAAQGQQLFVPFFREPSVITSSAQTNASQQPRLDLTPMARLGEPAGPPPSIFPPMNLLPHIGSIETTYLRGTLLYLGDKYVQLPDDAFVELFLPNQEVIIRRSIYRVAADIASGQLTIDSPNAQMRAGALQAFDFMIQIHGADKVMPFDGNCVDCAAPESPLPTPQPPTVPATASSSTSASESTIFPTLDLSPQASINNGTRGIEVMLNDTVFRLPDDTYIETVVLPDLFVPEESPFDQPATILRRGPYRLLIAPPKGQHYGEVQLYLDSPNVQTRATALQAFDFLIKLAGADKVMPPDATCVDCAVPVSPLPTP